MEKSTGKHYMLSALRRQPADRVPTTVLIGPYCSRLTRYSVKEILTDARKSAEAHLAFVHELMKFTTQVVKAMGDALIEAGFSPSLGEAAASCSLISPRIYREFIKPYHKELSLYFQSKKRYMSLHICGKIDPIMEDIVETGIFLLSLDAASSLEGLIRVSVGKLIVMGNVPTTLFSSGTQTEMEASIRGCINTAAAGSGYILASGCEIPLNSTEDRIEHFFEYSRKYGREYMTINRSKVQVS